MTIQPGGRKPNTSAPLQTRETGITESTESTESTDKVRKPPKSQTTGVSDQSGFTQVTLSQESNSPSLPMTGMGEKAPRGPGGQQLRRTEGQRQLKVQVPDTTGDVQISRPTLDTSPRPTQPHSMNYSDIDRLYPDFKQKITIDGYRMIPTGSHDGRDIEPWAEFKKPNCD